MAELPIPDHFDPARVGEVWRVPYQDRAGEAEQWAGRHGLTAAAHDDVRVGLLLVDVQNTFCIPGFELFVAGASGQAAVEDNRRLAEFVYRNLGAITQMVPSLDTHHAMQIFHAAWLTDAQGNRPDPMTLVTADDAREGRWRVDPEVAAAAGVDPRVRPAPPGALHAPAGRPRQVRPDRVALPRHAGRHRPRAGVLGGGGGVLPRAGPAQRAAVLRQGRAGADRALLDAGPRGHRGPGRRRASATVDHDLVQTLLGFDAVIVAGQAKSHCLAWTIDDLLSHHSVQEDQLAQRTYLLEDCTSPIVVPGVVDYTGEADAAFERFAAAGMHVVRSTDPIEDWPDFPCSTT